LSFININWYIALAFCLVFFIGGRQLAEVPGGTPRARRAVGLVLLAFALPSLLFPIAYLSEAVATSAWYNTFRAINRIELLCALVAPVAGYATYQKPPSPYRSYGEPFSTTAARAIKPLAFPFCVVLISVNFAGPLLKPLEKNAEFMDIWADRGVFVQSVPYTSGPASLINAMYSLNYFADSEYQAVKGTYTDRSGTEFWYLARYAVNHGYRTKFVGSPGVENAPIPSIMPVSRLSPEYDELRGTQTYIALLGRTGQGTLYIADPVIGRLELGSTEFLNYYSDPDLVLALSTPKGK